MSRWIDAEKELKELKNMKVEGETFTTAVNFAIITLEDAPSLDLYAVPSVDTKGSMMAKQNTTTAPLKTDRTDSGALMIGTSAIGARGRRVSR